MKKKFTPFRICALCLVLVLLAAYSNHFHNAFHFDDEHTIVNNTYIRSLHNIPLFFKSAAAFSVLPLNQTYRPMLTTLYAVAYWFNGTADTFYFHLFVFIFYLLTGIVLYLIIVKLFNSTLPDAAANRYVALFATGWYLLNTANADTINYLSSASDSVSAFWMAAAMALYMYKPRWRNYMLYLIPAAIGILFKQSALAFTGLIAVYYFFFESNGNRIIQRIIKTVWATLPSLLLCLVMYVLQNRLTSATYTPGGKPFNYIITQPFVMLHYFANFFFATGLTADTDWVAFASFADYRFWLGMLFVALAIYVLIKCVKHPKYAPLGFGMAWFFLALLPSSLFPLSEVMNDYRPFPAYMGLAIAVSWVLYRLWNKLSPTKKKRYMRPIALCVIALLLCNAVCTYARNRVWKTDESLWHDVTLKSPRNGRGLMNYGLTQMRIGNYAEAQKYFTRALLFLPQYAYLYSNMGVLYAAQGNYTRADSCFKTSILYGQNVPVIYYFYAQFLHKQHRDNEALPYVLHGIYLSPADLRLRYLAMSIYQTMNNFKAMAAMAEQTLAFAPADKLAQALLAAARAMKSPLDEAMEQAQHYPTAENYINLSLAYFNAHNYMGCITAAKQALKLKPDYTLAYNNIGSAYNKLGLWQQAEQALKQAVALQPNFTLAQNNYRFALQQQTLTDSLNETIKQHPTDGNYINLSLLYYRQGLYAKSVDACRQALKINAACAYAFNNMCAAYNNLHKWDSAIVAGQAAVRLNPASALARNNLAAAKQGKADAIK